MMNNNGVINGASSVNQKEQPALAPMAGVRIAPVNEQPVDASGVKTQPAFVPQSPVVNNQPVINQQQVGMPQSTPVIQQQSAIANQPTIAQTPPSAVQSPQISQEKQPPVPVPTISSDLKNGVVPNNLKKKKNGRVVFLLFLIILGLSAYIYYSSKNYNAVIKRIQYECSPVSSSKTEKDLDLNSTLVKNLYSKVSTNIREDLAQPLFNDQMKIYLAYRQILEKDKYDSNCNLFSATAMEPYVCVESTNFIPKAFKEETLRQEIKILFGENTNISLQNIQLGSSCIAGYQYIPDRGEFVQGYCNQQSATSYKVTKTLKEAKSTGATIVLTEEVKYHGNEKMTLPDFLKSGIYKYTFRLDMNYNYVFVDKIYEERY